MNAYTRNRNRKQELGISNLARQSTNGNLSTWRVEFASGYKTEVTVHRMATETGVIRYIGGLLRYLPESCRISLRLTDDEKQRRRKLGQDFPEIGTLLFAREFEFGIGTPQSDRDR